LEAAIARDMTPHPEQRQPTYLIPSALLFACAFLLYLPTIGYDFTYDDVTQVRYNRLVQVNALSIDLLNVIFTQATHPGTLYRPLTTLTLTLNRVLGGPGPASFHLINSVLFAVVSVIVYGGLRQIMNLSNHRWGFDAALAATLIWMTSPLHVEVVANVANRNELLSAGFGMSGFLIGTRSTKLSGLLLAALMFFFAVLSKESGITYGVILMVFLWLRHDQAPIKRRLCLINATFVSLVTLMYALLRYNALGASFTVAPVSGRENPENPLLSFDFFSRLPHALRILGDYLITMVVPKTPVADYSQMIPYLESVTFSLAGVISLGTLTAFISYGVITRSPLSRFAVLWFLLSFSLTANIITAIGTIRADRLGFSPSIGVALLMVIWLASVCRTVAPRIQILAPVACFAIAFSHIQITLEEREVWRDNRRLFFTTFERAPQSPKAPYNVGVYLQTEAGDSAGARWYFEETLRRYPGHEGSEGALARQIGDEL
jgi:hypothetical protein